MEAQIHDIAISTARVFLNPVHLSVYVVGGLAVLTGVAERVAISVEDILQSRNRETKTST